MKRKLFFIMALVVSLGLFGCYQVHSDDDLRSVPVTNNPNVIPATDGMSRLMAMP